MRIERGCAGSRQFVVRQQLGQLVPLLPPLAAVRVEYLGKAAPPGETHQNRFLVGSRRPLLALDGPQQLDRGDIIAELLFGAAFAQPIGVGDAVVVGIARRLLLMTRGYSSGGRRMYFSRTISHAWSWACCAVSPWRIS